MSPRKLDLAVIAAAVAMAVILLLATRSASAADAERGRGLYETRCASCHSESVHGRRNRAARDFGAVRAWVERWNANLELRWGAEEVEDVTVYLNNTYYRYPCPPTTCRVVSLAAR